SGSYYLGIIVDLNNQVAEANESDNAIASAATMAICTDNGREPNGVTGLATPVNATSVISDAYVCGPKDRDLWAVNLTTGQVISAAMVPPAANDYDLQLENAAGTVLATSNNGTGLRDSLQYTNPTAGTYYLRVFGFNA